MHSCEPLNLILAPQSCILTSIKRVQLLIKIPVPTLSVTNYSLSTALKLPQHSLQVGIGLTHMGLNLRQVSRLQEPQPCAVLCILILLNRKEVQPPVPKPPSLSALHPSIPSQHTQQNPGDQLFLVIAHHLTSGCST